MNLTTFNDTISAHEPPINLSVYLKAMWWDAKGDWEKAHQLIQDRTDKNAAWIHAYLHRKEGDIWNADYWYNRAGKKRPDVSINEEWKSITETFL